MMMMKFMLIRFAQVLSTCTFTFYLLSAWWKDY